jgi:hypothetical protein
LYRKFLPLLCFSFLALIYGCTGAANRKVTRGVYFWKTNFTLNENEISWLRENNIKKMYVRFFDVDWNPNVKQAIPVSEILVDTKPPNDIEIIPTVFITNRTLININDTLINKLAENIFRKISYKIKNFNTRLLEEIQLDCDWTTGTKNKYFQLINKLNEITDSARIDLTVTIRLHQVKYFKKTGVPPVKRGILMFYNMSDVSDIRTRNSIYDEDIAKRYLVNFDKYPLKLDVVLPAFSWAVLFRNKKISELINDVSPGELSGNKNYKSLGSNYFEAEKNNYLHGIFIGEKNIIRLEEITPSDTKSAADLITRYLKKDSIVVSIYHLTKGTTGKYKKEDWEDITSAFN